MIGPNDLRDLQRNLNHADAFNCLMFYKFFGISMWLATAGVIYNTKFLDKIITEAEEIRLRKAEDSIKPQELKNVLHKNIKPRKSLRPTFAEKALTYSEKNSIFQMAKSTY